MLDDLELRYERPQPGTGQGGELLKQALPLLETAIESLSRLQTNGTAGQGNESVVDAQLENARVGHDADRDLLRKTHEILKEVMTLQVDAANQIALK